MPPEYHRGDEIGFTGLMLAEYVRAPGITPLDRADRAKLLNRILQQTAASSLHWPHDEARIRRLKNLQPRSLDASNLRALTELPAGLVVKRDMRLCNNFALRDTPACLQVGESLTIQYCPVLRRIPSFGNPRIAVTLLDCAQLEALPDSARLSGDWTVVNCPLLQALPAYLDVRGRVTVENCPQLVSMSQELGVGTELTVRDCPKMVRVARIARFDPNTGVHLRECKKLSGLPESVGRIRALVLDRCGPFWVGDGLQIDETLTLIDTLMPKFGPHASLKGGLNLVGHAVLQPIPQALWTLSSLRIERASLTYLPKQLTIIEDLTVVDSVMPKMHRGMRVGGNVLLERCTGGEVLAPCMHIGGNLTVRDCSQARELAKQMRVGVDLIITGCARLSDLGTDIEVGRNIEIYDGVVPTLPSHMVIEGTLVLVRCHRGVALPNDLVCNENIVLEQCDAVVRLPRNLTVRGDFYAGYLPHWTDLGQNTVVHGSTDIEACAALATLGAGCVLGVDNNEVQHLVSFSRCPSLSTLPDSVESWRCTSVSLCGSGLSVEACRAFSRRTPHITWLVDGAPVHASDGLTYQDDDGSDARRALFEALAPWSLTPHKTLIDTFLAAVSRTADFMQTRARQATLVRLTEIFTAMGEDEVLAQRCLELMTDSLTSCEDRTIFGLDEMELALRVHQALGQADKAQALEALGVRLLKLDVVRRHAALACQHAAQGHLAEIDAIEIYLHFSTQLRARLDLPISTRWAMYGAEVSDQQLDWAAEEAEYAVGDPEIRADWFRQWAPWQAHQRHLALRPYEDIPVHDGLFSGPPLRCVITLAEAEEMMLPVYLGRNEAQRLYDYEALSVWYVQEGTDPSNRLPLDLAGLYRMPPPRAHAGPAVLKRAENHQGGP